MGGCKYLTRMYECTCKRMENFCNNDSSVSYCKARQYIDGYAYCPLFKKFFKIGILTNSTCA